jgi:hypothetical protein
MRSGLRELDPWGHFHQQNDITNAASPVVVSKIAATTLTYTRRSPERVGPRACSLVAKAKDQTGNATALHGRNGNDPERGTSQHSERRRDRERP